MIFVGGKGHEKKKDNYHQGAEKMRKIKIGGIIQNKDLAFVGILSFANRPGLPGYILELLGRGRINLQFIVHTVDGEGNENLAFCIQQKDLGPVMQIMDSLQSSLYSVLIFGKSQPLRA
jgi:hypothetical protein